MYHKLILQSAQKKRHLPPSTKNLNEESLRSILTRFELSFFVDSRLFHLSYYKKALKMFPEMNSETKEIFIIFSNFVKSAFQAFLSKST